jgi:tetratricopeptide (TPR) repeat protein
MQDLTPRTNWKAQLAEADELISDLSDAATLEDRERLGRALTDRGQAFVELGRTQEALASLDEVVARFDDASEPELSLRVAVALGDKARVLLALDRSKEALSACDAVLSRFARNSDARFLPWVEYAALLRAKALRTLGREAEAVEAYQQYLRDFSPRSRTALAGLARALGQLGRHEEAVVASDLYLNAASESSEPVEPLWIVEFLLAKARHLIVLGQLRTALASCEEVIDLLRGAEDREARESLAGALLRKAAILALEEDDAATAALDELLTVRHKDGQLRVNFAADELEKLKHGLARVPGHPEAEAGEPDVLWLQGGDADAYGFKVAHDLRDLD